MEQISLFEMLYPKFKITKPVRMIELFAGYGSTNLAMKYIGANYEHYKIVEWATKSIEAYNNMNVEDYTDYSRDIDAKDLPNILFEKGISVDYNSPMTLNQIKKKNEQWQRKVYNDIIATHNLVDISRVHAKDLEIIDRDKFDYILTYSFPCQDLSNAGLGKGMSKGSGTRSGLLWEVERILLECKELGTLPTCLILENVPDIIGKNNIEDFTLWVKQLEALGYSNFGSILNAKHYGIPQNRRRYFLVSLLGEWNYSMPKEMKLEYKLKDLLEDKVDKKYYLSKSLLDCFLSNGTGKYPRGERFMSNINRPNQNVANAITTKAGSRATDNFVINNKKVKETLEQNDLSKVEDVAMIDGFNRKIKTDDISTTITTGVSFRNQDFLLIKNATKDGYLEAKEGDGVDINSRMEYHRGTVQSGLSQTLTCAGGNDVGVVVKEDDSVVVVGNYSPSGHHSHSIVDKNGVAPTVMENHGQVTAICDDAYSPLEKELITEDGNIKRYLNSNIIDKWEEGQMATTTYPNGYGHGTRVHDESIALNTTEVPSVKNNLSIRKLTPKECFRLQGVMDQDSEKIKQGDSSLYHLAGDSICTSVLCAIYGEMFGIDYKKKIRELVNSLKEN